MATHADQTLVEEHDERTSGQQELYVVLEGEVAFHLDGEEARLGRGTAVAITDPAVRRGTAVAITDPAVRRSATAGLRSEVADRRSR